MIPLASSGRACSLACSSLQPVARGRSLSFATSSTIWSRYLPDYLSSLRSQRLSPSYLPRSSRRTFHATSSFSLDASRISYRVAASSSPKNRRFHPPTNFHNFRPELHDAIGVVTEEIDAVTRRKRRPDSGEDAFFVSRVGSQDSGAIAFAVADGVGGWVESKVDPANFSHALCRYMALEALSWDSSTDKLRAKNLLQSGYDQLVADKSVRAGGSTASVGVGLEDGQVELANLGDSGSMLLRLAAVHHYSVPQTHGFNTPMRAQASIFGGSFLEDSPRDAAVTNLHMQHGDVLMLATDGVYDNLNNQDILKLITSRMILTGAWTATPDLGIKVSDDLGALTGPDGLASLLPWPSSSSKPSAADPSTSGNVAPSSQILHHHTLQSLLASTVAGEAKRASMDSRRDGPFAKEAQRYYPGDWYRGGKVDDICVLIIVAVEEGRGHESR
ncbi:type 2C protein phosphatase PTC7 [Aspergillus novofumigatus IBT 16806]|uniref:Protein phosphatase n=1 Tax=Aspergillus novofumigatus (strain IBT 16806) TaxID=1392255 RepID=A0A2I1C024_ASPN1|nr:protein serine/threonine phosphatase 2C [Aspergillus novofumigatus IBT 16806]PKX90969.1 protein serine/threonine phosphatase 2C [Aspergillus novofumigatus IBT 16806]